MIKKNPILEEIRDYRAEREVMNNPKGWDHALRTLNLATSYGRWSKCPEVVDEARLVLTRLVALESFSKG